MQQGGGGWGVLGGGVVIGRPAVQEPCLRGANDTEHEAIEALEDAISRFTWWSLKLSRVEQ